VDVTLVVDALAPPLTGIGRYTLELCRRIPLQPSVGRVRYYLHRQFLEDPDQLLAGKALPRRRRVSRWINRRLADARLRASVVHGPNFLLPDEIETGIVTIHDLSVFRFPETHPAERLRAFERDFPHSLARASHIITDSDTVRRELIAEFGLSDSNVTAVPLGVAEDFQPRDPAQVHANLAALGLQPGHYGLCVSTLEPRKKIAELIRAWSALPVSVRTSTPLVLAGAKGWLNEQLHAEIRDGVAAGWLLHLGYVPDTILPALYAGACLFVYPSSYEGFGLPPLEAMASGVPVLVANRSCLPEICSDAAGYIDPDDVSGFSNAISEALTDSAWRTAARERGLQRAAGFTWDKCAAMTASIYSSVFR